MEFTSVFDEAGRDHDAEQVLRARTAANVETQALWPYLALASSAEEFGHRLALVGSRLSAIAAATGVEVEDIEQSLRSGFTAVLEGREASKEAVASPVACKNCHHANPVHDQGDRCPCGCATFQPGVRRRSSLEADAGEVETADHLASLRTALMEGQDPLAWIAETVPPGGPQYAEVPSQHETTQSFEGQPGTAYQEAVGKQATQEPHPFR